MLTSKGQAAAGNVPVHGQSPCASPICWELGWDSKAVGLCGAEAALGAAVPEGLAGLPFLQLLRKTW